MKSQDIFLLLKLISVEQATLREQNLTLPLESWPDWQNWDSDSDSDSNSDSDFNEQQQFASGHEADPYSVRSLADATGISKSEVSNIIARCYENGLAKQQRDGRPSPNRKGLEEFLIHGLRYVYPAKLMGLTRGIATGLTAPVFGGELRAPSDQTPVWADPRGASSGPLVEPLYKTVPLAVRKDQTLYTLLAITDSIRLGLPRERNLAVRKLQESLKT